MSKKNLCQNQTLIDNEEETMLTNPFSDDDCFGQVNDAEILVFMIIMMILVMLTMIVW